MDTLKRIIVAVDGSEPSGRAVAFAAEMARRFDARVTAVHVVEPLFVPPETYGFNSGALEAAHREYAAKLVKEASDQLAGAGVSAEGEVRYGAPPEALAEAALEPDVGLVVVGSRGRGAVGRVLLGSVSDRLVHLCRKPVLVVH